MPYVVQITATREGFDEGFLLDARWLTDGEASITIQWQSVGGFDAVKAYTVDGLPGVMEYRKDGKRRPVLIIRGPYTGEAFKAACLSIWGADA